MGATYHARLICNSVGSIFGIAILQFSEANAIGFFFVRVGVGVISFHYQRHSLILYVISKRYVLVHYPNICELKQQSLRLRHTASPKENKCEQTK